MPREFEYRIYSVGYGGKGEREREREKETEGGRYRRSSSYFFQRGTGHRERAHLYRLEENPGWRKIASRDRTSQQ